MATKTKKPTAKKTKPVKAAKPKKVTLLDTELNPLREADSILTDVEKAEAECERRALRVEMAKEDYTSARVAYKDAVVELRKLCRARKEKHPLFDAKPNAEAKIQAGKASVNLDVKLPTVTITAGTDSHGIPAGAVCEVHEVKPGGLVVTGPGINPTAVAADEYDGADDVLRLVTEARTTGITGPDAWREFVAGKQAPPKAEPSREWEGFLLTALDMPPAVESYLASAGLVTLGLMTDRMKNDWWDKDISVGGERKPAKLRETVEAAYNRFWAEHPEYCQA
jgi:hypothetical protein